MFNNFELELESMLLENEVENTTEIEDIEIDPFDEMSIIEAMVDMEIAEACKKEACKKEGKVCEKCGKPVEKCECDGTGSKGKAAVKEEDDMDDDTDDDVEDINDDL